MVRRLKRRDWEARLIRFIDAERQRPFEWGAWDCNTFALACIRQMTGYWLMLPELTYTDARSAYRFGRKHSLREILTTQLRAFKMTRGYQRRGDIAIVERCGLEYAHVVLGRYCVFPGVSGLNLGLVADLPPEAEFYRFD